jgi:hypothetical protein
MKDDELTPEERRAFDTLPRERVPNRALEERTVQALRGRGLLGSPARSGITVSARRVTVAAAAVATVVVGSFALGLYTGSRQTERAMLAMHEQDNLRLAAEVQRAGTAYIRALTALSESPRRRDPDAHEQGREAAVAALYAAAEIVVSLTPDDPLATNIVRVSEEMSRDRSAAGGKGVERRIVWF